MTQLFHHAPFAVKSLADIFISMRAQQYLQRHACSGCQIGTQIDAPHPARTNNALNLYSAKFFSKVRVHSARRIRLARLGNTIVAGTLLSKIFLRHGNGGASMHTFIGSRLHLGRSPCTRRVRCQRVFNRAARFWIKPESIQERTPLCRWQAPRRLRKFRDPGSVCVHLCPSVRRKQPSAVLLGQRHARSRRRHGTVRIQRHPCRR